MGSERHRIFRADQIPNREKFERRFWGKIDRSGDCWTWKGRANYCGYGVISISHGGGKTGNYLVHRVTWMLRHGEMPGEGLVLRHLCVGNRRCCNPDHLAIGTPGENVSDRVRDGRSAKREGTQNPMARLTPAAVLEIRVAAMTGELHRVIAARHAVTVSAVGHTASGARWSCLPLPGEAGWLVSLARYGLLSLALVKRPA